jgi:RNA polymerase sigma-70 factor, ECF subfamily
MIDLASLSDEDLLSMYYEEEEEFRADLAFTALERRYFQRMLLSLTIAGYNPSFIKLYNKPGLENKAEELVAEAMLRVAESKGRPSARWKRERQPRVNPWMFGILRNTVISFLRKKRPDLLTGLESKGDDEELMESPLAEVPAKEAAPDEALQNKVMMAMLRECVETLPRELREILEMIFEQGLKQNDIAKKLKTSGPTLSRRKQEAYEKLRDCLHGKGIILDVLP